MDGRQDVGFRQRRVHVDRLVRHGPVEHVERQQAGRLSGARGSDHHGRCPGPDDPGDQRTGGSHPRHSGGGGDDPADACRLGHVARDGSCLHDHAHRCIHRNADRHLPPLRAEQDEAGAQGPRVQELRTKRVLPGGLYPRADRPEIHVTCIVCQLNKVSLELYGILQSY